MNSEWKEMREEVDRLAKSFDLPPSFFRAVLTTDDWSFVVKLHALIETAITWMLSVHLRSAALTAFMTTLDLSGGRHSKLELAKCLTLLEADDMRFVRCLSKVRNRLVHGVRLFHLDMKEYVASLPKAEREEFLADASAIHDDPAFTQAERQQLRNRVLLHPKKYIWWSAVHLLAYISVRTGAALAKDELENVSRRLLDARAEIGERLLALTERKRTA